MSLFAGLIDSGATPLLEKMTAFTEARHRVIAQNIANIDTPGYRARQLDPAAFQVELRRASDARKTPGNRLVLNDAPQFRTDAAGALQLTPELEPAENVLFHDGTNARIERQMALLAENGMAHQLSVELLKGKFGGMMAAIRGRVQ